MFVETSILKIYFIYFMNYTRRTRRNEYYLDVSDFILTDPRQVIPSPRRGTPVSVHPTDVNKNSRLKP